MKIMVFKVLDEFLLYCETINAFYFKSSFDGGPSYLFLTLL
jgi:hypothetical protein